MGIDIYLGWENMTEEEKSGQLTGFATDAGDVGYLREAYHGAPYATKFFLKEYWDKEPDNDEGYIEIDPSVLRAKLAETVLIALYRNHLLYEQEKDPAIIDLSGDETVANKTIGDALATLLSTNITHDLKVEEDMASRITDTQKAHTLKLIEQGKLPDYAMSYVEFTRLAEKMEADGRNPKVYISA